MSKTYKILAWVTLVLLLGLGLKVLTSSPSVQKLGDSLVSTVATHYVNGIYAGNNDQFSIGTTGAITVATSTISALLTATDFNTGSVGSSSSSPAALGSSVAGFFTATTTTQSASTTSITANSTVIIQPASTTPFATLNVSCNTTVPSSTVISKLIPGNGFIVTVNPAATGTVTPYCFSYFIVN